MKLNILIILFFLNYNLIQGAKTDELCEPIPDISTTATTLTTSTANYSTGVRTVIELLAQFPDLPSTYTRDQHVASINTMCSYMYDSSYHRVSLIPTVTKFYTLPHPSGYYVQNGLSDLLHDIQIAVAADYGDRSTLYATYDHVIYWWPKISLGFRASAVVRGDSIFVNGLIGSWVFCHEMGHNFGLSHAHRWVPCDLTNPVDPCGTTQQYGDGFDMMGAQGSLNDFNPFEKKYLSWLGSKKVVPITVSGIYRIHRFDSPAAINFSPIALTVSQPNETGRTYWIAYRHNRPSTSLGAYVVWATNYASWLIDYVPSTGPGDSTIPIGQTLNDNGLLITPVQIGGIDPNYWIDIKVQLP